MTLDEYILQHIDEEGDYLKALYRDTHLKLLYPRMASGHLQGRMLKMFVRMIRPRQVLETGHIADTPRFAWQRGCRTTECCIRLKSMTSRKTLPVRGWRTRLMPIR